VTYFDAKNERQQEISSLMERHGLYRIN